MNLYFIDIFQFDIYSTIHSIKHFMVFDFRRMIYMFSIIKKRFFNLFSTEIFWTQNTFFESSWISIWLSILFNNSWWYTGSKIHGYLEEFFLHSKKTFERKIYESRPNFFKIHEFSVYYLFYFQTQWLRIENS